MTIADKLTLLANTKEALRAKLKLDKSVPFSKYPGYVNWQNIPSIPNKVFYADFTNDRYVKDGVPCSFKDLFTFSRAGKAWLVKDTGLQEYVADVPRLDDGLLIEQSATNFILQSQNMSDSYWVKDTVTVTGNTVKQDATNGLHKINSPSRSVPQYNHTRSQSLLVNPKTTQFIGFAADGSSSTTGVFIVNTLDLSYVSTSSTGISYTDSSVKIKKIGDLLHISYTVQDIGSWDTVANSVATIKFYKELSSVVASRQFIGDGVTDFEVIAVDAKVENQASSMIPTTATPVTRPADYLLNNITGTTVTGDWDSTLTLSIVAGKLVHSGYGRIRSLEIN